MTVAQIRIALVLSALGTLASCNDPPPEAPAPQSQLVAPHAVDGDLDLEAPDPVPGPSDAFYDRYHAYMTADAKRDYLSTPEGERFERFGLRMLDYQLREDLLREHEHALTRDEKDVYRRLPTADACRRFVAERTRRRGPNSVAPTQTSSRTNDR